MCLAVSKKIHYNKLTSEMVSFFNVTQISKITIRFKKDQILTTIYFASAEKSKRLSALLSTTS